MWPDKETEIDYLNFGYMVNLVADIATNRDLSPSTIGCMATGAVANPV